MNNSIVVNIVNVLLNRINSGDNRSVAVKKNIGYSLLIKGVSVCLSFLIVPLTLGYVNAELYGVWLTLSSILTWLTFFDIGLTQGLKNKLGEAIANCDWNLGKKYVSTTYAIMFLIFVPLFFTLELAIPKVNWAELLNINPIYNTDIKKALVVIAACFCFQMILNVLTSVIAAFQKVAFSSLIGVVGQFLSFVAILLLSMLAQPSLLAVSIAYSCMSVLVFGGATVVLFGTTFSKVSPSIKCIDNRCVRDIFNMGVKFFILQIQYIVYYQTTNFLISKYAGATEVTVYNIAFKYMNVVTMLFGVILTPLWPAYTEAFVKRDYIWMNMIFLKMKKVYWLINMLILIMLIVSPIAYHLWIGNRVSIPFLLTTIISLYVAITNWASLNVYIINGSGKIKLQTYITTIGMLMFIPFAILMTSEFGTYGIVTSLLAVNLTLAMFYTIQVSKLLSNNLSGIWAK